MPDTQADNNSRHRQLVDAIRGYLARGWTVVPCEAGSKLPAIKWQPFGERNATREEWSAWWHQWPGCNVAVVYASSKAPDDRQLVCIDTDSEDAEAWVSRQAPLPATPMARTAKGFHRYFYAPAGLEHFTGADGLPEVRAGVHYSVLPPSLHPSGALYEWVDGMSPDDIDVADLPPWGTALMGKPERPATTPTAGPVETVAEGQRNNTLFRVCAKWRAADVPEGQLRIAAHAYNQERFRPPLEAAEVDSVVNSVLRYQAGTSVRVQYDARRADTETEKLAHPDAPPEPTTTDAPTMSPDEEAALLATVEQQVNAVRIRHTPRVQSGRPPKLLADIAGDMIVELETERLSKRTIRGLRTGFPEMDWHYGGFAKQQLIVLQGPSGYGKTTFAKHVIFATALATMATGGDEVTAVFLLEASEQQLLDSYLGYRFGIPRCAREAGGYEHMTADIEERLLQAYGEFGTLPIAVTDDVKDLGAIEAHIRRLAEESPLAGVVIDHAQEVEVPAGRSRHEELSQVAARLRDLADRVAVPILLLSQTTLKDGNFEPEYSKGLRAKSSLSLIVTRGEPCDTRQEAVQSNKMTVFCDKSRHRPPNKPMVLYGDEQTSRLYDEAGWQAIESARYAQHSRPRDAQ